MAENSIEKPSKIQDSSRDPPSLATSSSSSSQEEKQETIRESKRRKSCPAALDKIAEFTPSNFSFTFDTRFSTSSQEFTPKFGSFNLVSSTRERPDDHTALCFHPRARKTKTAAIETISSKWAGLVKKEWSISAH
ncbi:hypothetical protein OIU84_026601 [Salix udensis]|uniref:Uncharacterized protein n=1 Tax=Salix udensis TaxID=889485 RepID=A0AAD6KM90_9ROSI|nr:hypothetical protein OIU84_026601 [Salix udensis]